MDVVTYALAKKYADGKFGEALTSVYTFKSSVNTFSDLPLTARTGDVYNVIETGINYAWDGQRWDSLSAEGAVVSGNQTAISSESGGENVFTFTKADGTTSEFVVKNGAQGTGIIGAEIISI